MNTIINTPLRRGGNRHSGSRNRFNDFGEARQTAEAVDLAPGAPPTPLKRGVNESGTEASAKWSLALFPLTPALSPVEREDYTPLWENRRRFGFSTAGRQDSLSPRERVGVRGKHVDEPNLILKPHSEP